MTSGSSEASANVSFQIGLAKPSAVATTPATATSRAGARIAIASTGSR